MKNPTKYIVQAKVVCIKSAAVDATSMKEACEKFLAGDAQVFDTYDMETKFISAMPEQ